jgi:hypothetical protein
MNAHSAPRQRRTAAHGHVVTVASALALVASFVVSTGGEAASAGPRLEIIAPSRASVGQPILLRLAVHDVTGLRGYEGALNFDRSAAHVSGMSQGDSDLGRVGGDVTPLGPDEVDEGVVFGAYSCPASDCVSRRGPERVVAQLDRLELAVLAITPERSGALDLRVGTFKFVDVSGRTIRVAVPTGVLRIAVDGGRVHHRAPASRSVQPRPVQPGRSVDLSGDGLVTNADAREVTLDWSITRSQSDPCALSRDAQRSDVNGDGCVDIADIQQVVGAYSPPTERKPIGSRDATPTGGAGLWVVDSVGDEPDDMIGDGVCATTSGTCTLRAAVSESNNHPGADLVTFDIEGAGVHRIEVTSRITLNDETGPTTIDGYTQPGALPNTDPLVQNAAIRIALRGPGETTRFPALFITSPDNVIRGLSLYRFWRSIQLDGFDADGNAIVGNFVGTNPAGTYSTPDWVRSANGGILINNGSSNDIGRPAIADRNVISGNAASGVYHTHEGTTDNDTRNNIIGLSPLGDRRLPNKLEGWDANLGASFNTMGGTAPMEGNVSSGNVGSGAEISHGLHTTGWNGGPTVGNRVIGNLIGTDVTGTRIQAGGVAFANSHYGVHIEDHVQDSKVRDNVVGGNIGYGIRIDGFETTGTIVTDNLVGIGRDGSPLPNTNAGINVAYHAQVGLIARNTVSNNRFGIRVDDWDNDRFTLSRNSIFGNVGLGIDLRPNGVNPNDPGDSDAGPNQGLDFPVLAGATTSMVKGQACGGCTVEVFVADGVAGRYGEGRTFVADAVVGPDGAFAIPIGGVDAGQHLTATATDGDGNTSEFSLNMVVTDPPPPGTPLATDTFTRSTTHGWGSAELGGAWSHTAELADYTTDGATGRMVIPAAGSTRNARTAVAARDAGMAATFSVDAVPIGGNAFAYLIGRRGSGAEYQAVVRLAPTGQVYLRANATVGSITTPLGSQVLLSGLTYTAGTPMSVRMQITGTTPTTVRARVWSASGAEPSGWQFEAADGTTELQDAGFFDLRGYLGSSATNAPLTLSWDDFAIDDLTP